MTSYEIQNPSSGFYRERYRGRQKYARRASLEVEVAAPLLHRADFI